MKQHQANELYHLMVARLQQSPQTPDGWKPRGNNAFVNGIECSARSLTNDLCMIKRDDPNYDAKRDKIAAKLDELSAIQGMLLASDVGWYCFFCGWLFPEQVNHDGTCALCGSKLPSGTKSRGGVSRRGRDKGQTEERGEQP